MLKRPVIKKEEDGSGGNYWVHSSSTISQVFKSEELKQIDLKIDVVAEKKRNATLERSKNMFQKNIEILASSKDIEFGELKPYFDVTYLKNAKSILVLNGVSIQIIPNHVFVYEKDDIKKVGAIWFVAKKDGYSKQELSLFVFSLYQYLMNLYSSKYEASIEYCIAFDITKGHKLNYKAVLDLGYLTFVTENLKLLKKAID
ncbi:hypothetical protein [Pedobacter arcticus]|uniref:hypothetical protein n=1 Tax=Pedobacter arcticus TaxID=752140 RepID=UPI0012B51FE4|nr:hypothetical protein [Pedobacter arcticus]